MSDDIEQLRQAVIDTSIALYFCPADGTDEWRDGTQMRNAYAEHHAAVNTLMAAMGNKVTKAAK